MNQSTSMTIKGAVLITAMTLAAPAPGALVQEIYDDFIVQYDDAAVTLFGPPLAGGNTVFFLPNSFEAFLPYDPGAGTTRQLQVGDTVSFAVLPHGNQVITGLSLVEQGDFTHLGGGVQDAYIVFGRVFVRDADNPAQFTSTAFEHIFQDNSDTNILDLWSFEQAIDTPALVSDAWVTLENFLVLIDSGQGFSPIPGLEPAGGFGSEMFIQKKFIGLQVDVAPVPIALTAMPVPATIWFMVSALGLLRLRLRRGQPA